MLTRCFAGTLLAWHAGLDGDHQGAIERAQHAAALASEHGFPTWLAAATLHLSIGQCGLGRHEEGLPLLLAILDAWRTAGRDASGDQLHPVLMTPYFAGRAAEALLETGETELALAELDRTLADSAANGECFWDAELLRLRARARRHSGFPVHVWIEDLAAARAVAEQQRAEPLLHRVEADLATITEEGR
jgi:hypothetical protein